MESSRPLRLAIQVLGVYLLGCSSTTTAKPPTDAATDPRPPADLAADAPRTSDGTLATDLPGTKDGVAVEAAPGKDVLAPDLPLVKDVSPDEPVNQDGLADLSSPLDLAGDTDPSPGMCTGSYDACGCGCCGGGGQTTMCYYPTLGETIAAIAAEDEAKTAATNCALVGCSRGVHYVCCMPADPEPAASATYTVSGYAGGFDHLGIAKSGADCAVLSFVGGSPTGLAADGFHIENENSWVATDGAFGPCGDAGALASARGAIGTLAFRTAGDKCVLDLHATLFVITAAGEVKTTRMDADGVEVTAGLPSQCR